VPGWDNSTITAVKAVRFFIITATLLVVVAMFVVILIRSGIAQSRINIAFWCTFVALIFDMIAVCGWAAFHNDVLVRAGEAEGLEVGFGAAFDLAVATSILLIIPGVMHYLIASNIVDEKPQK